MVNNSRQEIRDGHEELAHADSDLNSLLRSSQIATLLLDESLQILGFTPAIADIYALLSSDVGRPLNGFVPLVRHMPPLPDPKQVRDNAPIEHTVIANSGKSYIRRVLPYVSHTGENEGMVVTFNDVTQLRGSEELLLRKVIDNATSFVILCDGEGAVVDVNAPTLQAIGLERKDVIGTKFWDLACWNFDARVAAKVKASLLESARGFSIRYDSQYLAANTDLRKLDLSFSAACESDGSVEHVIVCGIDITDRVAAEQQLRDSENRFRTMVDNLPLLLWVHDDQGRQLTVNQAFCNFYHVDAAEMRDMKWQQLIHREDFENYTTEFERCVLNRQRFNAEVRVRRGDGQWRWLESWGQPCFSESGKYVGHIGASADITDRKQQAANLSFIAKLQQAIDSLSSAQDIARTATDRVFEFLRPARCNLVEFDSPGESAEFFEEHIQAGLPSALGCHAVRDLLGFHELQRLRSNHSLIVNDIQANSPSVTDIAHHPQFNTRTLLIVPHVSEEGLKFALALACEQSRNWQPHELDLLTEVTNRVFLRLLRARAEETLTVLAAQLSESNERLELATSAAKMGAFDWNIDTDVNVWDAQHLELTGLASIPSTGRNFLTRIHPDDVVANQLAIENVVNSGEEYNTEFRFRRPDGQLRWLAARGRVVRGADGCRHFIGLNWDITEQRDFQQSLKVAREAAEAANESKSAFLANMSHEIRTPMTAILGYAELLQELLEHDEAREYLQTIRRNGDYLLELINDILDLSKIEAGKLEIDTERFQPRRLVDDVRRIMEVRARDGGLELKVEYLGKLPNLVESDAKRLKQILINLVGNAIKFTRQGQVTIRMQYDCGSNLRFDVIDTGIGMSPDQLERLFQPFSQGDASVGRKFGGTGLGLAISQRLAKSLGGQIVVTSQEGIGSTFSLSISVGDVDPQSLVDYSNATPEEEPTPDQQSAPPVKLNCRVLVVDDRREIRYLAQQILSKAGASIDQCEDGQQAVDHVMGCMQTSACPDLIVLDMQMPVLDGYETARQLRTMGYRRPIIALTADAMPRDMNECIDAGCNNYLSKPIDAQRLVKLVSELVRDKSAT